MRTTVVFKRVDKNDIGRLLPFPRYASGVDEFNKVGEGEIRQAEIKNPRNLKKHNMFMAQLRMIVANCPVIDGVPKWKSVDQLRRAVMNSLGLYELGKDLNGNIFTYPISMSFESMDEDEFDERIFTPAQPLLAREAELNERQLQNPDNWEKYL